MAKFKDMNKTKLAIHNIKVNFGSVKEDVSCLYTSES